MDSEYIGVGFLVFRLEVTLRRVRTEPPRVNTHHVNGRLSVDYPLRQLPAGAPSRCDSKAMPFIEPYVFEIPCRADNWTAVRRITDRSVINLLDADLAESRHSVNCRINVLL